MLKNVKLQILGKKTAKFKFERSSFEKFKKFLNENNLKSKINEHKTATIYSIFFKGENLAYISCFYNKITTNSCFISNILFYLFPIKNKNYELIPFICEMISSNKLVEIIKDFASYKKANIITIGNAYIIFSENLTTNKIEKKINYPNWNIHLNYLDEYNSDLKQYISHYHLIWNNPDFDEKLIPKIHLKKMAAAVKFSSDYNKGINPFKNSNTFDSFAKVLQKKEFYQENKTKIERKLKIYKFKRKFIWAKLFLFKNSRLFSKVFIWCFKQNCKLFSKMNFRLRVFDTKCKETKKELHKYKDALILTLIECINSEGSSYPLLINESGEIRRESFNFETVRKMVGGRLIALLEMNISKKTKEENWLFIGISSVKYRKNRPKILSSTLLFPKLFRGYGFGQFIAMLAMEVAEEKKWADKFEVFATSRNFRTNSLVKKIGFFDYGFIPNVQFDISGYSQEALSYAVGINRTYSFTSKMLKILIQREADCEMKESWKNAYQINEGLKKIVNSNTEDLIIFS